ncbi:MAG: rRNA maturation RNase YbeY [Tepidisphaeraceae bacterium]|jgi:probable rRNA maturation factor
MNIPNGAFTLSISARSGQSMTQYLRKYLRKAHGIMRSPLAELSVALVGDATMSALHERHMGIPGPTDVLTFELDRDDQGRVTSGEVVVCVPQARRQAKGPLREEVLLCALHGMLHLNGLDDRTPRQFDDMHKQEDMILTRLGIGRVFSPDKTAGDRR